MKILNLRFLILLLFFVAKSYAMNADDIPPAWEVTKKGNSSTFSKIDRRSSLNKIVVRNLLGLGLSLEIEGRDAYKLFTRLKSKLDKRCLSEQEESDIRILGVRVELESISEEERIQQLAAIFIEAEVLLPGFSVLDPFIKREIGRLDSREIKKNCAHKPEEASEAKEAEELAEALAAAKLSKGPQKLADNNLTMRDLVGEEEDFASCRPYRKLVYKNSEVYFVKPFASRELVIYIKLDKNDRYDYIKIIKTSDYRYNN
ncbi:MAG: hypothetical protein ACREGC_00605, partial [Minisyncoccia bacterium]